MILTIAVPAYNMEKVLRKNLFTYVDTRILGKVEVLVLDNSSEDCTGEIAEQMAVDFPGIFHIIHKENQGYGSSVNYAMGIAQGKYFRVVDADDFVDTEALVTFVEALQSCDADVIQTPYCRVFPQRRETVPIPSRVPCNQTLSMEAAPWKKFLPCLHSTTYRTALLQEEDIRLQHNTFFVDEEFVTLPFLHVKTICYLPINVYRYSVGNPSQSTSASNRAKYRSHRERVVRRLLTMVPSVTQLPCKEYFLIRTTEAVGDHLTTLLMYVPNRMEGRQEAKKFYRMVQEQTQEFVSAVEKKYLVLCWMNTLHISLGQYFKCKEIWFYILRKLGKKPYESN